MRKFAIALLLCLASPGCSASRLPLTAPALESAGSLFVYLLPLPREASRLTFTLDEMAAIREDGTIQSLRLLFKEARGDALTGERRLATQELPPGRYTGLSLRIGSASLEGQGGDAPLTPPRDAITLQAPFTLAKKRAVVLTLDLNYRDSVGSGFQFVPDFTARIPAQPAPGLVALASSRGSNTLALFDKITARMVGIIPTGAGPAGMALDSARQRVYVADSGDDSVEAVGLLEQAVLSRLTLKGGDKPLELALTPNGRTLLSANVGSGTVSVIDAVSLVETGRITVGNSPTSLVLDRSGNRAFVFNSGSSSITVLDVSTRSVVTTIGTESGPFRGEIDLSGDRLYVIHLSSPYLTIIDTASLSVASRVYIGPGATALKVDSRADRIYVARKGTGVLEIYDPLSLLSVDSVPTGGGDVSFLAIDGEGNYLYLSLPARGKVLVIRIVGKEMTAEADVGGDPYDVTLLGER